MNKKEKSEWWYLHKSNDKFDEAIDESDIKNLFDSWKKDALDLKRFDKTGLQILKLFFVMSFVQKVNVFELCSCPLQKSG